jgi:hypothetical protein
MSASEDGRDANAGRLSHRASVLSEGLKRHDSRMGGLTASAIAVVSVHELGRKQSIRQLLPRFTQAKSLRCLVESICQDRPDRILQCGAPLVVEDLQEALGVWRLQITNPCWPNLPFSQTFQQCITHVVTQPRRRLRHQPAGMVDRVTYRHRWPV